MVHSQSSPTPQAALKRLLNYSLPYRARIIAASTFSVLNKLFDILPEVLIGVAVDVVVNQQDSFLAKLGYKDVLVQLWILGGLTLIIWVLESIFEYLYSVLWRNLAQTLQHDLRSDAYSHIQNLDMAYFEDRSTGNLVAILNDDINQLERFLDTGANTLIQVAATFVLIGGIFFFLAPGVAIMAMAPIPFILVGAFWFQKRAQPLYASVREKAGLLAARLANNISGIATIKSFVAEDRELQTLLKESNDYRQANSHAIQVSSAFIPIIRMAIMAGFIATLVYGGWLTVEGDLAIGSYGVMVFLTQRLLWPLTGLAQTADLYERAMASANRVLDLIATPIAIRSGEKRISPEAVSGQIEIQNLHFQYGNRPPVLHDINISIPSGTTAAFVGSTGSGKSTLVKLLLRFYDPTSGQILLDGVDIQELDSRDLRRAIGFVSQDVFLFHGSVRENIAFGKPDASLDEIVAAAKAAEAHDFIMSLPEQYDTLIGERGQKLSGGQRQRLSIARAVLKDPPVMILDEATSAVDNETEAAIQRSLKKIAVGRTTIVIAHRLSTIVKADQIFVMENGRVIEYGKNEELIKKGGSYASLWRVQTGLR